LTRPWDGPCASADIIMEVERSKSDEIIEAGEERRFRARNVGMADIPELHHLDKLCFPQERAFTEGYFSLLFLYHQAFGWALEPVDTQSRATLRKASRADSSSGFQADGGAATFVASILVTIRYDAANIATIDVHPLFRRLGLGKILMRKAEAELRRRGIHKLILQVAVGNSNAISLYEKTGFRKIKTIKGYYGGKEDGIVMEKLLEQDGE
jgi:ribosomal protein S18 acetylase RimI-like enzyme